MKYSSSEFIVRHAFQATLVLTETKTFGSNNVWEENKDGGKTHTGHRSGKCFLNRPEHLQSVKGWKFFSSFSSWRRRRLSRFRDCQMLFSIYLLWATWEPEKPWLQQFSNHRISKCILKWLSERSPPTQKRLQQSQLLGFSALCCMNPSVSARVKLERGFLAACHHIFFSNTFYAIF